MRNRTFSIHAIIISLNRLKAKWNCAFIWKKIIFFDLDNYQCHAQIYFLFNYKTNFIIFIWTITFDNSKCCCLYAWKYATLSNLLRFNIIFEFLSEKTFYSCFTQLQRIFFDMNKIWIDSNNSIIFEFLADEFDNHFLKEICQCFKSKNMNSC